MTFKHRLKKALGDPSGFTIPEGTAIGPTDISLSGRDFVEVGGAKGLTVYEETRICVRIREGLLTVCGKDLTLKTFCRAHIAVCGKISSLTFEEERKDRK